MPTDIDLWNAVYLFRFVLPSIVGEPIFLGEIISVCKSAFYLVFCSFGICALPTVSLTVGRCVFVILRFVYRR